MKRLLDTAANSLFTAYFGMILKEFWKPIGQSHILDGLWEVSGLYRIAHSPLCFPTCYSPKLANKLWRPYVADLM